MKLERFAAGFTQLEGTIPADIWNLPMLQHFEISGSSNISGFISPVSAGGCPNLRRFQVSSSPLLQGNVPDLSQCSSLTTLYLSGDEGLGGPLPLLPSSIKYAHFDSTDLSGPIPDSYASLPHLEVLFLGNSPNIGLCIPSNLCDKFETSKLSTVMTGSEDGNGVFQKYYMRKSRCGSTPSDSCIGILVNECKNHELPNLFINNCEYDESTGALIGTCSANCPQA